MKKGYELEVRMKSFYEDVFKIRLMRRTPVIIRIDGKGFSKFTSRSEKPFDKLIGECMRQTALYLCENIQGCELAYTQSDEISLLLIDYRHFNLAAWFNYSVQKICSVSASMATLAFNDILRESADEYTSGKSTRYYYDVQAAIKKGAMFDSRAFNIPKEEVTNYFLWRQQDAERNSLEALARHYFSTSELYKKSRGDMNKMLLSKGVSWDKLDGYSKSGACVVFNDYPVQTLPNGKGIRMVRYPGVGSNWFIDANIPSFVGEGRDYIDRIVNVCDE